MYNMSDFDHEYEADFHGFLEYLTCMLNFLALK